MSLNLILAWNVIRWSEKLLDMGVVRVISWCPPPPPPPPPKKKKNDGGDFLVLKKFFEEVWSFFHFKGQGRGESIIWKLVKAGSEGGI